MLKLVKSALVISATLICTNSFSQTVTSSFVCTKMDSSFEIIRRLANEEELPNRMELLKLGCGGIEKHVLPFDTNLPHVMTMGNGGTYASVQGMLNGRKVFSVLQIKE